MGECSRLCVSVERKGIDKKRSIKVYAIRFNRARAIEARNFENCGFYFISVFHLNFSSHSHSLSFSRLFVLFNYSSRGKLYLAESFVWYIYEAAATTMASAVAEYGVWWFDQRRHKALAMNSSWEIDCSYNFFLFCFVVFFGGFFPNYTSKENSNGFDIFDWNSMAAHCGFSNVDEVTRQFSNIFDSEAFFNCGRFPSQRYSVVNSICQIIMNGSLLRMWEANSDISTCLFCDHSTSRGNFFFGGCSSTEFGCHYSAQIIHMHFQYCYAWALCI